MTVLRVVNCRCVFVFVLLLCVVLLPIVCLFDVASLLCRLCSLSSMCVFIVRYRRCYVSLFVVIIDVVCLRVVFVVFVLCDCCVCVCCVVCCCGVRVIRLCVCRVVCC